RVRAVAAGDVSPARLGGPRPWLRPSIPEPSALSQRRRAVAHGSGRRRPATSAASGWVRGWPGSYRCASASRTRPASAVGSAALPPTAAPPPGSAAPGAGAPPPPHPHPPPPPPPPVRAGPAGPRPALPHPPLQPAPRDGRLPQADPVAARLGHAQQHLRPPR